MKRCLLMFSLLLVMACGLKTDIVVPEYGFKGQITNFKACVKAKSVILLWHYQGTKVDHFVVLREEMSSNEHFCPTCPSHLKFYAKVFPHKAQGNFRWQDLAIIPKHRYLYQVCAITVGGNKICSQIITVLTNQGQP